MSDGSRASALWREEDGADPRGKRRPARLPRGGELANAEGETAAGWEGPAGRTVVGHVGGKRVSTNHERKGQWTSRCRVLSVEGARFVMCHFVRGTQT